MPLRVATLNVGGLPSALPPLRERAPELGRWFEAAALDVVCLQEVWTRAQLRAVRAALPSYPYAGLHRGPIGPAGGLVTCSRRPLDAVAYTPFRGARAGGELRFRARQWVNTRLQGVLTVRLSGGPTVVANTHLTANKDGDWSPHNRHFPLQRDQLDRLRSTVARAAAGAELTVVCGDFNVASTSSLYPAIVDGYTDPFAVSDPATFHAALLHPGRRPHRIDYLLVRGDPGRYPVLAARPVFTEPVPDFGLVSDHAGLTADIGLPTDT